MSNKDSDFVKGMQAAAKPVVVMLIAGVAFSMARSSVFVNVDFTTTKTLIIFGLFFVSGLIILGNELIPWMNVHPALIIVASLLVGGFFIR
jgi:chromate transport protein ChrA